MHGAKRSQRGSRTCAMRRHRTKPRLFGGSVGREEIDLDERSHRGLVLIRQWEQELTRFRTLRQVHERSHRGWRERLASESATRGSEEVLNVLAPNEANAVVLQAAPNEPTAAHRGPCVWLGSARFSW